MITCEQALTANNFEHRTLKNADGTPLRARRNGKTKTWKHTPRAFKIPCKYGLKQYFYIEWNPRIASELDGEGNARDWEVTSSSPSPTGHGPSPARAGSYPTSASTSILHRDQGRKIFWSDLDTRRVP